MYSLSTHASQSLVTSVAHLRLLADELVHVDASRARAIDDVADTLAAVVEVAEIERDRYDAWMDSRYQDECERARTFTDADLEHCGLPVG